MPITKSDIIDPLGSREQGAPDSLLDPIIAFIDRAKSRHKLMIAVQKIDQPMIAEAIVQARQQKVTVDVVLEHDYLLGYTRRLRFHSTRLSTLDYLKSGIIN